MKNVLWYLGFLSAMSLLYFVDGDGGFLCFLGFVPYFATYWTKDERVELNIGRAARNAVLWVIFSGAVSIVYFMFTGDKEAFRWAFVALWAGSLSICLLSFFYYDAIGK